MTDWSTSARQASRRRAAETGFSLIEVLISMLIALVTFLIMFQMFESWDRSKRTTASGGGAMISGSMAMFRLERDLHLAGFGFGSASELGCTVTAFDTARPDTAATVPGDVATASHEFGFPLVPFLIVDGGAGGAPDEIVTTYGSSEGVSTTRFFGTATAGAQPYTGATSTSTTTEIGARAGIQMGDLVILAQSPTQCNLVEVTDNTNTNRRVFSYTGTDYTSFYTGASTTPRFNPASVTVASATGNVYVMGPRPQRRVWQIRNNRTLAFINDLSWTDTTNNTTGAAAADGANDFTDVADNIVNLQAQYGFTGDVTGATPPCAASATPTWTTTTPAAGEACRWAFLWAVRVALLARSDQYEKAAITTTAPTWAGGSFGMTNLDGSAGNTVPTDPTQDWRHYRYKVFESMIPLKNIMWGSR